MAPSAAQAAWAALPHPAADVPANPAYLQSSSDGVALQAINNARAGEGLGPLPLPAGWGALSREQQVFALINLERTTRGLPPLAGIDANLSAVALQHSQLMVSTNQFGHCLPTCPDVRIAANPLYAGHWSAWAENIAGNPAIVAGSMYEFMYNDSAEAWGHRDNILSQNLDGAGVIGIGIVDGGGYGHDLTVDFLEPASWSPFTPVLSSTWAQVQAAGLPQAPQPSLSWSDQLHPNISWAPVSGAGGYGVELIRGSNAAQPGGVNPDPNRIGATAVAGTSLQGDTSSLTAGSYCVRVIALGSVGFQSSFSPCQTLAVGARRPGIDLSWADPQTPVFTWSSLSGATGYGLELIRGGSDAQQGSLTADPNRIAAISLGPVSSYTGSTAGLAPGTYSVRVIAWSGYGFLGGFSDSLTFTVF